MNKKIYTKILILVCWIGTDSSDALSSHLVSKTIVLAVAVGGQPVLLLLVSPSPLPTPRLYVASDIPSRQS
jgi:hypothetical protein